MNAQQPFRFSTGVIGYPIAFVLLIWIVFWFEVRFGYRFNYLGVFPRTLSGLGGVVFSPFIHGSLEHLYHNSTPLLVLSTALFYFYRPYYFVYDQGYLPLENHYYALVKRE